MKANLSNFFEQISMTWMKEQTTQSRGVGLFYPSALVCLELPPSSVSLFSQESPLFFIGQLNSSSEELFF